MCDASLLADHALMADAVDQADRVLERYLGVRIAKAGGIGSGRGFARTVARVAERLRARAAPVESEAVKAALGELSVSWGELTGRARDGVFARAARAAAKATEELPGELRAVFRAAGGEVLRDVRAELRRGRGVALGVDFNAVDPRIVAYATKSHALFVRDELGRRSDTLSARARKVVADGLEAGHREADIARALEETVGATLKGKTPAYWDVVAGSFVGTSRSFGQMSAFAEAGIERYRLSAVLDEQTTRLCRFLDGKTFSVSKALGRFADLEDAEGSMAIKDLLPWGREAIDPETGKVVLYAKQAGRRVALAVEERTGFGRRDDRGEFRSRVSDEGLEQLGVSLPPFHGACRTVSVSE